MTSQFIVRAIVPKKLGLIRGNFRHFLCAPEPHATRCVCYRGTAGDDKMSAAIRFPTNPFRRSFMTITTAHIPAIVALIAGILVLIMPRLLNLVVAIYLICIGLIGLGVLKWLHM
jgi:hypothetical protein